MIKLKAKIPIGFNICKISANHDQLQAHKFQGKPVNILARKKSVNENIALNNKIDEKLFLIKGPTTAVATPKNKLNNSGNKKRDIGIKYLKLSSKVNE